MTSDKKNNFKTFLDILYRSEILGQRVFSLRQIL